MTVFVSMFTIFLADILDRLCSLSRDNVGYTVASCDALIRFFAVVRSGLLPVALRTETLLVTYRSFPSVVGLTTQHYGSESWT